jgi:hypothetical protein
MFPGNLQADSESACKRFMNESPFSEIEKLGDSLKNCPEAPFHGVPKFLYLRKGRKSKTAIFDFRN